MDQYIFALGLVCLINVLILYRYLESESKRVKIKKKISKKNKKK